MLVGSRGHHLSPSRYGRAPEHPIGSGALRASGSGQAIVDRRQAARRRRSGDARAEVRAPTLAPVSCFLTLRTMLASAKNCHRLLRAQVATQKGHSRVRAFRGVLVSRCDLRALVCRNPYRTAVVAAQSVCDRAQCDRSMSCGVYCAFKEAHHRTARRRRSECASRVRAMLYGRRRVNNR